MSADVGGSKRAAWNNHEARLPGIFQGCFNQFRSDSTVRKFRRNLRVRKNDRPVIQTIVEPRHPLALVDLKSMGVYVV